MIFFGVAEDKAVVEIHVDVVDVGLDGVNKGLERHGGVPEAKGHPLELIEATGSIDACQELVLLSDRHKVKSFCQVNT